MPTDKFTALAHDLLRRSGIDDGEIYVQVTRGAARRNHQFPENTQPTVVIGVRPPSKVPSELWQTGCNAIIQPDERWSRCDLKTICLLPNVLAKERAYRAGAFEALLVRGDIVSEGTASNLFILRHGKLITPIADNRILAGITRAVTIELAHDCGYHVVEKDIETEGLFDAQEVFITSTTIELMPVVKIDDHIVGDGLPGSALKRLLSAYREQAVRNRLPRLTARSS